MSAVRHNFVSTKPVEWCAEMTTFYRELRGHDYHKTMPIPRSWVSDNLQIEKHATDAILEAMPKFAMGIATEWRSRAEDWAQTAQRLQDSKQKPNEVYAHNVEFWLTLRRLCLQLGAMDMIVTPGQVMVWAVKDTLSEHAETVQDHAVAVYEAGRAAVRVAGNVAGAIPTIAKAVAVSAVGLGVYAVAKRR